MISMVLLFLVLGVQAVSARGTASSDTLHITASDGTRLFVSVRGEGTPCLYIHGGPGVGSYWMEKLYGDVLEKHFKMIYLDQRGSGRSDSALNGDYSPERMAKDFDEVRQALGIERWITFGHSFGGILQMKHAELYPQTVSGMMMVEVTLNLNESLEEMVPKALDLLNIKGPDRKPYLDESTYPLDRIMPLFGKMREQHVFWKMYYAEEANSERMDSVMMELPHPNPEFGSRALGMAAYYEDYKRAAPTLQMPVLYFYGTHDWAVGPSHYKNVHFPHMMLRSWEGGHVPFMEGRKQLEAVIDEWLAGNPLPVNREQVRNCEF